MQAMAEVGAFLAVMGLVMWQVLRRKNERNIGLILLMVIPGAYLLALPLLGGPKWLNIPGYCLLGLAYPVYFTALRRERPSSPEGARETSGPD